MNLDLWMTIGFLLAAYSVIANDSVQTLGTFIASNSEKVKWYWMWAAASLVLIWDIGDGWIQYDGDISYGRLNKIPFQEVQWYHALAPSILLILTRYGVPVSTSFLVLSAFASGVVLEKMMVKSFVGYGLAAIAAFIIWHILTRLIDESKPIKESHKQYWRIAQWGTTGMLWWAWLSHDLANIAVFLPRQLSLEMVITITIVFVIGLAFMFREKGGRIQNIVLEKHNTRYVRSATIIDLVYWLILWFFKELNDIPMSTTFVFVGLLMGREYAIASFTGKEKFKRVFPLVMKDFLKLMIGVVASIAVVLTIHSIQ